MIISFPANAYSICHLHEKNNILHEELTENLLDNYHSFSNLSTPKFKKMDDVLARKLTFLPEVLFFP
ncbi:MAG: hypothetical protein NC311_14150, partial [Muribaculaceae bacterium]|nr:hypothetical protein [Muribaculaceae bacterium]